MMKKIFTLIFVLSSVIVLAVQAQAALETRGTDSLGNRLIYDSDLNITWYDFARPLDTWQNQMNWVDALSVNFNGTIYDDWRLPMTSQPDSSCESQLDPGGGLPLQGYGYNCTGSEMGHLFYTELGNSAEDRYESNLGDFQHLILDYYWSATDYAPLPDELAWRFSIGPGFQRYGYKDPNSDHYYPYRAIAVRAGDVTVVPEPLSSILFVTGGMLLVSRLYVRRRERLLKSRK